MDVLHCPTLQSHDDALENARVVVTARVEAKRRPKTSASARFVDVPVKTKHGPVALDDPSDGGTAHRNHPGARSADQAEVGPNLGCVVDPGSVWGNVQVVDRGPAGFEIRDERGDARFELALREFARAVPRRDV